VPDRFLDGLLVELRGRGYPVNPSFEVLATVTSSRGTFGLRFNSAPRRRFVVCAVSGLEWTLLGERDLGEGYKPGDAEFLAWLVELIGPPGDGR